MTKIAINGFGRIGRLIFKELIKNEDFEVVAVNDLGDLENLAYLLKYDTVYGRFDKEVRLGDRELEVAGKRIK
ncbi:MAG: type I glyceraldehyde-3-phosphate dehydrogenase, partial [Patescibacteria group bacterium]|nr:type I glyceraldehyde-3-phosphate dehydrogenase [Patescibacteria group bacterium]